MTDGAQTDQVRDAKDFTEKYGSLCFLSTGIFFVIMLALKFAYASLGLENVYIYTIAAIYFVFTVAFFAYILNQDIALVQNLLLVRRKKLGDIGFMVAIILFSLLFISVCILLIWKVGFANIIDDFINKDKRLRELLIMHLTIPFSVLAIWFDLCALNIIKPSR